jgi:rRNA-processing protein FCF1
MSKTIVDANVLIDCFQQDSIYRDPSLRFVELMVREKRLITVPAHGWFEVWCALHRLSEIDRKYLPPIFAGQMQLPLELVHIDDQFIRRYGNVRIPFIKGGDHIYLVVAHVNHYRLVTRDGKMRRIATDLGVDVSSPAEYVEAHA